VGEWSKFIGETGEDISSLFLHKIGWGDVEQGFDIPCIRSSEHSSKKSPRKTHGIDRLFVYPNPMSNRQLTHAVVSVKTTDEPYPGNPVTKFRGYLEDLAGSTECYAKSEHRSKCNMRFLGRPDTAVHSVLLWFSLAPESRDAAIIADVAGCKFDGSHHVFVVDNARASFLFETITYAEQKFGQQKAQFFYFNNGKSFDQTQRLSHGRILPIEYLNAEIIPMVFETGSGSSNASHFVLATSEPFSEVALHRVIGLAKDMTQKLASTVVILFRDFFARHENDVRAVKGSFSDKEFTERCSVDNFTIDFRKT
jgi:hypothetical protein